MKRFLTLLAFVVATISSYAYHCEVDGIYYYLSGNEASVTSGDNKYTGSVVIPEEITYNGYTYSVTSIRWGAFERCYDLISVNIPNSVTSIELYTFYDCSGLTSVTIGSSVTSIGSNAFSNCRSLTSVTIPNSVTSIGVSAFDGCSGLTSVTIGSSVTSIGSNAFAYCSDLTSITIPNSVTSIGVSAFDGCTGLTSVTIGSSVTSIGSNAFFNCISLTSVTIPNSVTSIGESAFANSGLTSVTIPNSVTSIGESAFSQCYDLTSVTIGSSVTSIGSHAFSDCRSLTSVTIPNSVTSIGKSAFNQCYDLTSVTIGNSVMSIGEGTFLNCGKLSSLTIGNSVTSIGEWAFSSCSNLASVTIPNSVTSIGNYAFNGCRSLTSVTIGNSLTSIGDRAFNSCSDLNTVYCYADEIPSTGSEAFEIWGYDKSWNWVNKISKATLYVPSGSIDAYKSTDPWSQFGTILPIPVNNLKIESVYADKNSEDITLSVGLDNETQFTSVMFDLYLPEGVTALKDDLGYYMDLNNTRCNSRGGFTLEGEEQADGAVRVMLYSSRGTMIAGDSGELFTITLKTAGNVAAGNHKFEVKRVICAVDVTAEGRYELKNADGYVRVKGVEEISLTVPEGGYATLCLPYAASIPAGLKAYKATGVNDDKVVVEEQQNIPACTPLIIMGTPGNYSFSGNNSAATKFEYNVGSLKASLIPAESSEGYVLQDLSEGLGFYKISRKLTVPANRCVLEEAAASAAPAFVPVSFDEDANAIEATDYKLQTTGSAVYTLDGQHVKTMEKGKIYIVNGVKVMVK